jgi:hypothetical protein
VGVAKVHFSQNNEDLGNRKCLGKPRKSFVGHPNAILFLREGVFQQPRLFSTVGGCEFRLFGGLSPSAVSLSLQHPCNGRHGLKEILPCRTFKWSVLLFLKDVNDYP